MNTRISQARAVVVGAGYLRTKEASTYLSVSVRTIRSWTQRRILAAYKPTKRLTLYRAADLDVAMQRFRTGGKNGGGA